MKSEIDIQLYKKLCDASDIEAELKNYNDYYLLYYFSTARRNLYDWFEFDKSASLLEIGSECGALTGLFGERVSTVLALEEDKTKAEICKYRFRENANIEVVNTDIESFESDDRYDYVVMTGTISGLKDAKKYLKKDGIIFVAVSNRMGLAYLAGEVDSNVGKPFKGLTSKSGLYSRKQLLSIIEGTGLDVVQTYYPMPDYRFTSVLYSDDYLPIPGDFQMGNVSFSDDSFKVFDETSVADTLIESGEFVDFANSFLFVLK